MPPSKNHRSLKGDTSYFKLKSSLPPSKNHRPLKGDTSYFKLNSPWNLKKTTAPHLQVVPRLTSRLAEQLGRAAEYRARGQRGVHHRSSTVQAQALHSLHAKKMGMSLSRYISLKRCYQVDNNVAEEHSASQPARQKNGNVTVKRCSHIDMSMLQKASTGCVVIVRAVPSKAVIKTACKI